MPRGGRRLCTRSIHWPDRSASADEVLRSRAIASRSGPSGSARPRNLALPCRRQSSASPDHGAAVRRRSRPRIRRAGRTPTDAAIRPAHGDRSCRCAHRQSISPAIVGQPKRIVEFAICEQPSIGGDDRSTKLQHQAAIKIEPQCTRFPLHPSGSPSRPPSIPDKLLIAISESRHGLRKSVRHPANAG